MSRRLPLTLGVRHQDASEHEHEHEHHHQVSSSTMAHQQVDAVVAIDSLDVMSSATEAALAVAASLHPSSGDHQHQEQEMEMDTSLAQNEMEQEVLVHEIMEMPLPMPLIDMDQVEQQQLHQQYHDNNQAVHPPPLPPHDHAALANAHYQHQPEVTASGVGNETSVDMNVGLADGEAVVADNVTVELAAESVQENAPVAMMEVQMVQAMLPAVQEITVEEQHIQPLSQENIAVTTVDDANNEAGKEEQVQSTVATTTEPNTDTTTNSENANKVDTGIQEAPALAQDQVVPPQDQAAPPEKKDDAMEVDQESGTNAGVNQNEDSNLGNGLNNNDNNKKDEEQNALEDHTEPSKKSQGRPRKSDAKKTTPKKKAGRAGRRQSTETVDSGTTSEPKKKRGRPRKSDVSPAPPSLVALSVKNLNISASSTPGDIARAWCEYRKAEFEYHDLDDQALEVEQAKTLLEETTKHVMPALLADQDSEWNQMYQRLKEYHGKYGHVVVPRTNPKEALESIPHLDKLGEWVAQQRLEYRKSRDKPDKYAPYDFYKLKALDELGFVWDLTPPIEKFFQRVDELRVFRSWYGDCNVPPTASKTEPGQRDGVVIDPLLSKWVMYVRQEYRRTKVNSDRNRNGTAGNYLTQDRIKLLTELGLKLEEGSDAEWDQQLQNVKKFYDTYGHFCMNVMIGDYYAELQEWLEQQRVDSKEKNLSKEQSDKLKDAGIKFYTNGPSSPLEQAEVAWCQHYEQLRAYQMLHGTADIQLTPEQKKKSPPSARKRGRPKKGETASAPEEEHDWETKRLELAEWCDKQRDEYIKFHAEEATNLTGFKIDRLDLLDFTWKLEALKTKSRKRSVEPEKEEEDEEEEEEQEEEEEETVADDDDSDEDHEEETKTPAKGATPKRGRGRPKRNAAPKPAAKPKEEEPAAIVNTSQRSKRPRRSTEAISAPPTTEKATPASKRKRGRPRKDSVEKKDSGGTKKASL